jgi:hypothetical protein
LLLGVSALCAFVALSKGRSTCWAPLESPRQHDDEHHHGVHGGSPPMQRAIFMDDRHTGCRSASGGSANLGLSRLARSQLGDLRVVGRDDALESVIMPCVVTEAPARVQCEAALQSRIGRNSLGTSISSRGVGRGRSRPEATAPRNNAGPGGAPVMPPVADHRQPNLVGSPWATFSTTCMVRGRPEIPATPPRTGVSTAFSSPALSTVMIH